jgi:hypothetical protein
VNLSAFYPPRLQTFPRLHRMVRAHYRESESQSGAVELTDVWRQENRTLLATSRPKKELNRHGIPSTRMRAGIGGATQFFDVKISSIICSTEPLTDQHEALYGSVRKD